MAGNRGTPATPDTNTAGAFREDRAMPPTAAPTRSVRVARNAAAASAVATLATTFLPWASSGSRARSSYAIIDIVERAGVLSSTLASLSGFWFLLPVLVGATLLAVSVGSARLVALTTGTIAVLVITGALLVARSPLVVEPGLVLAVGAGACTGCTGIGTLILTRRQT